jgi:hypothetical protein
VNAAPREFVGGQEPERTWRPAIILPPTAPPGGQARFDRWAYRRGEPRFFVLVWTTFLFSATLLTLTGVGAAGYITGDVYGPAARILMMTVAAGVVLLWPMIRLSQEFPEHGGFGTAMQDLFIVLLPSQAVVWPQWWLAGWRLEVVAVVVCLLTAWGSLVGALLAMAMSPGRGGPLVPRWAWMLLFVAIALAGTIPALLDEARGGWKPADAGRLNWMLSPLTAVFEVTADRPGVGRFSSARQSHWAAVTWTAGISVPVWVAAWSRGGRRAGGLH